MGQSRFMFLSNLRRNRAQSVPSADIYQDLMRKEYMGEITIQLLDWFDGGDVKLWDDHLPASPFFAKKT